MNTLVSNETVCNQLKELGEYFRANGHTIAMGSLPGDPLHGGHLKHLKGIKQYGTSVIIVNSNKFLLKKKGYYLIDEQDRLKIIQSIRWVDYAFLYESDVQHVGGALQSLQPHYFCNGGGDRSRLEDLDPTELEICREYNIKVRLGVGGIEKDNSSSKIVENFIKNFPEQVEKMGRAR